MRPRALAIALGLSLVVNVFVLGGFAGVLLVHAVAPQPVFEPHANPLIVAANGLDPADRDAFRTAMQDVVQREGPTQLDSRMARRQAAEIMRAQNFDRAAVSAALDRARADDGEVRRAIENAVLDFAAKLDARGRATLSAGLAHGPGGLGRGLSAGQPASPPKQP